METITNLTLSGACQRCGRSNCTDHATKRTEDNFGGRKVVTVNGPLVLVNGVVYQDAGSTMTALFVRKSLEKKFAKHNVSIYNRRIK